MDSMSTSTMQIPSMTATAASVPNESTTTMGGYASSVSTASLSAPRLLTQHMEMSQVDGPVEAASSTSSIAAAPTVVRPGTTGKSKAALSKSAIVKVNSGYAPGRHVSKATGGAKAHKPTSAPSTPTSGAMVTGEDRPTTLKRGPGRPPGSGKPKPPPSGRGPGRPPGSGKNRTTAASAGVKRKRSLRDEGGRDGSLSSDDGISETKPTRVAMAATGISSLASTPLTTTKSGRQVQKPETYNPVEMDLVSSASTRRMYQTPESKTATTPCRACGRIADTRINLIVFCDGCNYAWHQNCHTPSIDDSFITDAAKAWHCAGCAPTKAGEKKDGRKASSKTGGVAVAMEQASSAAILGLASNSHTGGRGSGKASWMKRTSGQKRAYLSGLSHADLVELVIHCTNLHPDMPIFPTDDMGSAVGTPTGLLTTANSNGSASHTSTPTTTGQRFRQPAAPISSSAKPSDEGLWEDIPGNYRAWKRPDMDGAPTTRMGALLRELEARADAHLEDPGDYESFSHTLYDVSGLAVDENGMLPQRHRNGSTTVAAA